jgi:signal peptidase II
MARVWRIVGLALVVFAIDEAIKSVARLTLAPCSSGPVAGCEHMQLVGPLSLVRTANAGSVYGFVQGWFGWVLLAAVGVVLIPLYARFFRTGSAIAVLAIGLQLGGAAGNLLDRVAFGGASDILYLGGGPTWNLADIAIAVGTLLATAALLQTRVWDFDARQRSRSASGGGDRT